MAFARAYPDGPLAMALRWAHYRELLVLAMADHALAPQRARLPPPPRLPPDAQLALPL